MADLNSLDSLGRLDSIGNIPGLPDAGGSGRRQRPLYRQPFEPEEQDSVAKKALNAGSSGIGYVLGGLDKPGSAVRSVLAGKGLGAGLRALTPFSSTMGLASDKDYTSGRDLLDTYGVTNKHDKGWGAWGAGLAADIATDPLTYTTFGAKHALTPLGKIASKAGATKGWSRQQLLKGFSGTESALANAGGNVAHELNRGAKLVNPALEAAGVEAGKPLAGLGQIGLPFGPKYTFGTGATAQKFAGQLDKLGKFASTGNPVGRAIGGLFDSRLHGADSQIAQEGAKDFLDPALQKYKTAARADVHGVLSHLDPIIQNRGLHNWSEEQITSAATSVAEGMPWQVTDPALHAAVAPVANDILAMRARDLAGHHASGTPLAGLTDAYRNPIHRQSIDLSGRSLQLGPASNGLYPVASGQNMRIQKLYRDIPGGSNRIDDWFRRFATDAPIGPQSAQQIKAAKNARKVTGKAIFGDMMSDLKSGGNLLTATPELQDQFLKKSRGFAKRLQNSTSQHRPGVLAPGGIGLFTPNIAGNVAQSAAQTARTRASADAATALLARHASPLLRDGTMLPLSEAIRQMGMQTFEGPGGLAGALPNVYRGLAQHGAGPVDSLLGGGVDDLSRQADRFGITQAAFDQIKKAHVKWNTPNEAVAPLKFIDSFTNAFKGLTYPAWIPSHVRNAFTAAMNNVIEGAWRPTDYLAQHQAMSGRGGRDLSHLLPSVAGLPIAEQNAALRQSQYVNANMFSGHGIADDVARDAKTALATSQGRFTPHAPGAPQPTKYGNTALDAADLVLNQGALGTAKAGARTVANAARDPKAFLPWNWGSGRVAKALEPMSIKGVGGAEKDLLPGIAAGRTASSKIEDFFRGALYNSQLRKGVAPEMAGDLVNKTHFNYDELSGFEKNVMRRVVPFYTYMRKNLPMQIGNAIHRPGAINAQYKPFRQQTPGEDGYVPGYLASGVAVPTGHESPDGNRQYISKLGLPAEEAFERLHFRNGLPDVGATVMDYMGGMNPLIKAPLEQLFDKQFHTQRNLSDLKPTGTSAAIGHLFGEDNPQLLGQAMSNSPLTRFFSTADKLTDPRKAWYQKLANLGTGVRVTDVDVNKQRAVETRDALQKLMAGHPALSKYTNFYVKPEDASNLTPEEVELMRAYSTIQDQAKAYNKEQRGRIGIRP